MVFEERNIENNIQVVGVTVDNVERFEYLGSLPMWDNNYSDETTRRIGKATDTMTSRNTYGKVRS